MRGFLGLEGGGGGCPFTVEGGGVALFRVAVDDRKGTIGVGGMPFSREGVLYLFFVSGSSRRGWGDY